MENDLLLAIAGKQVSGNYRLGSKGDVLMDQDFIDVAFDHCIIEGGDFASSSFINCYFKKASFIQTSLMAVSFIDCKIDDIAFTHCEGDFSITS